MYFIRKRIMISILLMDEEIFKKQVLEHYTIYWNSMFDNQFLYDNCTQKFTKVTTIQIKIQLINAKNVYSGTEVFLTDVACYERRPKSKFLIVLVFVYETFDM